MRLHLLDLGSLFVDKGRVQTPGSGEGAWVTIPVPGYLIETDDGTHILVDTGLHRGHISNPGYTFGGTPVEDELKVIMRPENDPVARLAELGFSPDDIDILVATHFHFDHAGNHSDFGASRIVVQQDAIDYNRANFDPYTRNLWDHAHLHYDVIDGDTEIAPGVELLKTTGHAPGHMSLLVRLPNSGTVILAIDAISTFENLETSNWALAHDPDEAQASAERLATLRDREGAMLITGHDPAQWATLESNRVLD